MELGEPCWNRENVEKAISHIAQVDATRMHYFLASHSPIKFITDARLDRDLTEEEFFQSLFFNPAHEQLGLVKGEPGTGKSHLIGWLKLRCQSALENSELKDILPVIIQRRSGSLKDALDQLIRQLPEQFERYLNPVKDALKRITETTARETLAGKFHLEFGDNWKIRGRQSLPSYFKNLREICTSQGFREWLCRDGGVMDRNVKRLIESSNTDEREQLPEFSAEEFYIRDHRYMGQNTPAVRDLIDDFLEYAERREEAANAFNCVLPAAIKEMTGLSGATLRGIFDQIRLDLKAMGKGLALFIEDVSVMSALDEEVINAVEPQGRHDLCPLTAVLGITVTGAQRLPDNQRERVTCLVSVGGYGKEQWRANIDEVARFTARYLNTVRLEEETVQKIANDRRKGADVTISKCDDCPVRIECHKCFGKVDIDGTGIGMFPFTYTAPQRLLEHLDEQREGVRKNPRGLLMHVLRSVLSSSESLSLGRFPEDNLPVILPPLMFWQRFEQRYCSGWEPRDIKRLNRLARGWVSAVSEENAASALNSFLKPLGFREFSRKVVRKEQDERRKKEQKKETEPTPEPEETPPGLLSLLQDLDTWTNQGQELNYDAEPRQLLAELIRNGIPWDDDASVPLSEWKRHIRGGGYRFIQIDGMRSKLTTGNFLIDFPRSKKTHDLICALAKFKYLGKNSWNFRGGETEKRLVSSWLRQHNDEIIEKLRPGKELDPLKPVTCAAQFLAIVAMLRKRARLSEGVVDLVEEVLADVWRESPTAFDKDWAALIKDMQLKHRDVREFLFNELSIPQGRTGGINFIDPLPIVESVNRLFDMPFAPPESEYFTSFWQSRYAALDHMNQYVTLAEFLEKERSGLSREINRLRGVLKSAGYDPDQPRESIAQYCKDLLLVVEAQRIAKVLEPDKHFDEMLKTRIFSERQSAWGVAVEKTESVIDSEDPERLLLYDPKSLQEAVFAISYADSYMQKLSDEVDEQLQDIEREGDPDTLFEEFKEYLWEITSFGDTASLKALGDEHE